MAQHCRLTDKGRLRGGLFMHELLDQIKLVGDVSELIGKLAATHLQVLKHGGLHVFLRVNVFDFLQHKAGRQNKRHPFPLIIC